MANRVLKLPLKKAAGEGTPAQEQKMLDRNNSGSIILRLLCDPVLRPCLSPGGGHFRFHLSTVEHYKQLHPHWVLGPETLSYLSCMRLSSGSLPLPYPTLVHIFIHYPSPLGFSPVSPILDPAFLFPLPPLFQPPKSPMIILTPFYVGFRHSHLGLPC